MILFYIEGNAILCLCLCMGNSKLVLSLKFLWQILQPLIVNLFSMLYGLISSKDLLTFYHIGHNGDHSS